MIYLARILSLVGGVATLFGVGAIFIMSVLEARNIIPAGLQDKWMLVVTVTSLSGLVLLIGQLCGNDLFKILGKDSVIALKQNPDRDILNDKHFGY